MVLGVIGLLLGGAEAGRSQADILGTALLVVCFLGLNVWLLVAVPRGNQAAYYVQLVLSVLGLLGFPLGTLLNGYILYCWSKPETKAWFGIP